MQGFPKNAGTLNLLLAIVAIIVKIQGSAIKNSFGISLKLEVNKTTDNPSANPNIKDPINIPNGFQFPKKQIAKAIHPLPPIILLV